MRSVDVTGQKFHRLTAVAPIGSNKFGRVEWRFACDCGGETIAVVSEVKRDKIKSCGCLKSENAKINGRKTHGPIKHKGAGTAIYAVWKTMRQRCNNLRCSDYYLYGGRGIKVCARWDSFELFASDMGPRPAGYTIERINNDGDYTPDNCRWASVTEQANNRRPRGSSIQGVTYGI